MKLQSTGQIKSILHLYDVLPENERIITDILRQIITGNLPTGCKEKISFNVPYFYGKKGICIVWPSAIPRGGIKSGVLLGFWYGNRLRDVDHYLVHGTNKRVFYKIYTAIEEIDEEAIVKLLKEAVMIDMQWTHSKQSGAAE